MGADEGGYVRDGKEWSLKRNLEDAEILLQE
jgi:hypothetical protein